MTLENAADMLDLAQAYAVPQFADACAKLALLRIANAAGMIQPSWVSDVESGATRLEQQSFPLAAMPFGIVIPQKTRLADTDEKCRLLRDGLWAMLEGMPPLSASTSF